MAETISSLITLTSVINQQTDNDVGLRRGVCGDNMYG